jgi:hypothetical protein
MPGVLDFLNPSGGPLFDLSLLNLGSETETRLSPETMNVESLNLYLPKTETATQTVTDSFGDILSQIMPFAMFMIFMQMMK